MGTNLNANDTKAPTGGFFVYKYKLQTLEQVTKLETNIPANQLKTIQGSKETTHPLYFYYPKKITSLPSGDFYLTAESKYGRELIVQQIGKTGSLLSSTFIPIANCEGEGFFEFTKNNNLYLICNDSKKNLDLPDLTKLKETMPNAKNTIPIAISIKKDGSFTKEQILSENPELKSIYPRVYFETKTNQSVIFSQKDKKVQFLKINY